MSKRVTSRRKLRKFSIGDLRDWITIYTRAIQSPGFNDSKVTEKYTLYDETWASVTTLSPGAIVFDDVNIDPKDAPTHLFTIRWIEGITTEKRIFWEDSYYRIIRPINPEERCEYLMLYSKFLGDFSLKANQ